MYIAVLLVGYYSLRSLQLVEANWCEHVYINRVKMINEPYLLWYFSFSTVIKSWIIHTRMCIQMEMMALILLKQEHSEAQSSLTGGKRNNWSVAFETVDSLNKFQLCEMLFRCIFFQISLNFVLTWNCFTYWNPYSVHFHTFFRPEISQGNMDKFIPR